MNRKKFISSSFASIIGLSAMGMIQCNKLNLPRKPIKKISSINSSNSNLFKLSLAQWSIHKQIENGTTSPFEFASIAKKWGFSGLEYVNDLYKIKEGKNVKQKLDNFIKISNEKASQFDLENLIIMVDEEGDLSIKSKSKRKKHISNHFKWIDAAVAMKCHSVRINLFGVNNPDAWKEYSKESLLKICEYAIDKKINILVENHGYLSSNASLLMEVINEINMTNCGTLPDFGNFCLGRVGGDRWDTACIEEYDKYKGVKELLPKAFAVSAKSYDFDNLGNETSIDYLKMLQMVKDSGYRGYIGVEYEGERLSEMEGSIATKNLITSTIPKLS